MATTPASAGARSFGAGGPTLAETGEAELLRLLLAIAADRPAAALVAGPGDDAAIWAPGAGLQVALTQDALVEGEDFRREWITPRALGRRAISVALSDLAAMGAHPAWCMATLCASGATPVEDVLEIQRGVVAAAAEAGCPVAGGDLSDIDGPLVVDVAAGGTAPPGAWLRRDQGRAGDTLLVTGRLGAAAAGLRCLLGEASGGEPECRDRWIDSLLAPRARIAEGRRLAAAGVRCAGDISDGLIVDAGRTAAASACGAELWLDRIPAAPGLRETFGARWPELALAGGEDFELVCAAPPDLAARLLAAWPPDLAPLTPVGRLTRSAAVLLLASAQGPSVPLPAPRSRHWR